MTFTVQWSDHALERAREQAKYITRESGSTEVAWKWASNIFDAADALADFPNIGRRLAEFPETTYREIIVRKNFRLIYRVDGDKCIIITVRRCSMLLDSATLSEFDAVE